MEHAWNSWKEKRWPDVPKVPDGLFFFVVTDAVSRHCCCACPPGNWGRDGGVSSHPLCFLALTSSNLIPTYYNTTMESARFLHDVWFPQGEALTSCLLIRSHNVYVFYMFAAAEVQKGGY